MDEETPSKHPEPAQPPPVTDRPDGSRVDEDFPLMGGAGAGAGAGGAGHQPAGGMDEDEEAEERDSGHPSSSHRKATHPIPKGKISAEAEEAMRKNPDIERMIRTVTAPPTLKQRKERVESSDMFKVKPFEGSKELIAWIKQYGHTKDFVTKKGHWTFSKDFFSRATGQVLEGCSAESFICTRSVIKRGPEEPTPDPTTPGYDQRGEFTRELFEWNFMNDFRRIAAGDIPPKERPLLRKVEFSVANRPINKDCNFLFDALYRFQEPRFNPKSGEMSNVLWVWDSIDGVCRLDMAKATRHTPSAVVPCTWYPHPGRLEDPKIGLPMQWHVDEYGAISYIDGKGFFFFEWRGEGQANRVIHIDIGSSHEFGLVTCVARMGNKFIFANKDGYIGALDQPSIFAAVKPVEEGRPGHGWMHVAKITPEVWAKADDCQPYKIVPSMQENRICILGLSAVIVISINPDGSQHLARSNVGGMTTAKFGGPLLFFYHRKSGNVVAVPYTLHDMKYAYPSNPEPWIENFPHCEDPLTVIDSPSGPLLVSYFVSSGKISFLFPKEGPLGKMLTPHVVVAIRNFLREAHCTPVPGEVINKEAEAEHLLKMIENSERIKREEGEEMPCEEFEEILQRRRENALKSMQQDDV